MVAVLEHAASKIYLNPFKLFSGFYRPWNAEITKFDVDAVDEGIMNN